MRRPLDLLLSEKRSHSGCCAEKRTWRVKGKSKQAVIQARDKGNSYQGDGSGKKQLIPEDILEARADGTCGWIDRAWGGTERGIREGSTVCSMSIWKDGADTD